MSSHIAQDYLEAVMHDPPPLTREQWQAEKDKKLEAQRKKVIEKKEKVSPKPKRAKRTSQAKINQLSRVYIKMGIDMARDHLYDDPDVDSFRDWASTAAGEAAYSLTEYMSGTEQLNYELIKNAGVSDVSGWIADYIHDGMLKALDKKSK